MQCQGCPREPGLLHSPVPPSPSPSGQKSPPGRAALAAGTEAVPLPAVAPRECRRAAGPEAPALPGQSPRSRISPSAGSWQPPRRGAPPESETNRARRRIPEPWKGEERRRVCCCLRWLRSYRNSSLRRQRWPRSIADQLPEIFVSVSPSQPRSGPGRGDARTLLGKPRAPAGAASRGASLESWLLERAWEGAALRFHLCPRA